MMKILVTGASGFVGSHLVECLSAKGFEVTALGCSRLPAAELGAAQLKSIDLTEAARELAVEQFDAVLHAAALARIEECEENPEAAYRTNVLATEELLKNVSCPVLYFSTDLVFDGEVAPAGGFSEEDFPQPRSVYAKTKREAELRCLDSERAGIARLCLVYGSVRSRQAGFLKWMLATLRNGESLDLFEDEWRTPVSVFDVCRLALAWLKKPCFEIIHVTGNRRVSRFEFGEELCRHAGFERSLLRSVPQATVPMKAPRSADVSLKLGRMLDEYGVAPGEFSERLVQQFCWEKL